MKTIKQVRECFWQFLNIASPELAQQRRSKKTQNDYCADIRMIFCDWVDAMHKNGQISDSLANKVTL